MKDQSDFGEEQVQPALAAKLTAERCVDITMKAGAVCAIAPFMYTTGLLVGITAFDYERRYCYERASDARQALAAWDGVGHPSGPWIKCKGAGIDLLNPAWSQEPVDSTPTET